MKKAAVLASVTLPMWQQSALAHEGHGVSAQSILHYLSASHLMPVLLLAAVVGTTWYLVARTNRD